jgi:hypothetical protein
MVGEQAFLYQLPCTTDCRIRWRWPHSITTNNVSSVLSCGEDSTALISAKTRTRRPYSITRIASPKSARVSAGHLGESEQEFCCPGETLLLARQERDRRCGRANLTPDTMDSVNNFSGAGPLAGITAWRGIRKWAPRGARAGDGGDGSQRGWYNDIQVGRWWDVCSILCTRGLDTRHLGTTDLRGKFGRHGQIQALGRSYLVLGKGQWKRYSQGKRTTDAACGEVAGSL